MNTIPFCCVDSLSSAACSVYQSTRTIFSSLYPWPSNTLGSMKILHRPVPSVSGIRRRNPRANSLSSFSRIPEIENGVKAAPWNNSIRLFQYLAILSAASYCLDQEKNYCQNRHAICMYMNMNKNYSLHQHWTVHIEGTKDDAPSTRISLGIIHELVLSQTLLSLTIFAIPFLAVAKSHWKDLHEVLRMLSTIITHYDRW